jgi:hypothetical protein
MDQIKYSIAVKLVGHEADVAQGYSVARYLVSNEQVGRWLRGILEGNDNNWLLGMILRHPDIIKRQSNVCVVRCGKCSHLMVTLDDAAVPLPGTLVPTISIDVFLAMNHGGCFLDDKIHEFGVLRDGSLFDHIRSGIDSGFNLGDLRVYVYPNIHAINEVYTDATEGGRLVRFRFQPESWNLARDVMIDDLESYIRTTASAGMFNNTSNIANPTNSKKASDIKVNKSTVPVNATFAAESNRGKKFDKNPNINDAPTMSSKDKQNFAVATITKKSSIATETNRGKKADKTSNNNDAPTMLSKAKKKFAMAPQVETTANKIGIAASSCFYAPFCKKLARDCGGIRKGLCAEVNTGKIKIPTYEVFLEEKRKMKNKQKKDRKAMPKDLIVPETSNKTNVEINERKRKGTTSTTTSILFNPREYILLSRAWNDELTLTDMIDTGEKYTEQDCNEASIILTEITEYHQKETSNR